MRKIILVLLLGIGSVSFAQEKIKVLDTEKDTTYFFVTVEQMPEFPGGEEARIKFIADNLVFPKTTRELPSGTVTITFIVEIDGRLSNFKVVKSVHPLIDEEALRVVKLMPNWIPGKQRDKPVRVHRIMHVKFVFEEEGDDESQYCEKHIKKLDKLLKKESKRKKKKKNN